MTDLPPDTDQPTVQEAHILAHPPDPWVPSPLLRLIASLVTIGLLLVVIFGGAAYIVHADRNDARDECFSRQFAAVFIAVGEAFNTTPGTPQRSSGSRGIVDAAEYIKRHPC